MTTRSYNRLWMARALVLATLVVAVRPASALSCAGTIAGAEGLQSPSVSASCAMMRCGHCGHHDVGRAVRPAVFELDPSSGCHCWLAPLPTLPPAAFNGRESGPDSLDVAALPGSISVVPAAPALWSAALLLTFYPHDAHIRSYPPRGPPASCLS
jgi:hypothetical protein